MKQGWWSLLLLLALLPAAHAREGNIARIDRLQSAGPEQQAAQRAGLFSERRFDTGDAAARMLGNGEWRVQPDAGVDEPLLVIYHPYSARVTVRDGAAAPRVQDLFARDLDPQFLRRALVFPLSGDGAVQVKVENARYPLRIAIEPRARHVADDLDHLRRLLPALGVVLGVSLAVLLFWAMLRDWVYLLYAASMLLQLLYLLCSYGEAYSLPYLRALARFGAPGIWAIGTLATISMIYMWQSYAGLRRATPRLSVLMRVVGVHASVVMLMLLALPWPADKTWFPDVANALFLATNAIAIATLSIAWARGQRHAGYVLIAWVPLVVFTLWRALRFSGGERVDPWLDYGLPLVHAFNAVVLALGLADRMLTFRTERDRAKEHAERDVLTGVLNRGGIEHRLDWAVIEMERERIPVSLLFIDLDQFKKINDRHGHALGDACLRAVARVLSEEFQYGDQLGRMGGEEFVLVLAGADQAHALQIAERVRTRIQHGCAVVDGVAVDVTASIGVAEGAAGDTVASLIARADQAMYVAKRAGGNRVIAHGEPAPAPETQEAPEGASVD